MRQLQKEQDHRALRLGTRPDGDRTDMMPPKEGHF